MDLSPTMHSSFIITFDLTKVTINNDQLLTHLLGRHLSFIAPSNVPFLVKGGGPFCGPQLFSFCTWKLFAFQGSSGHQWQKNIQSPLFWPELSMQYNESEVHRIIPPNRSFGWAIKEMCMKSNRPAHEWPGLLDDDELTSSSCGWTGTTQPLLAFCGCLASNVWHPMAYVFVLQFYLVFVDILFFYKKYNY